MATWAICPDLFLYTKRKDVYLWRCNETTWMPMKTADFDDLGKVTDYQDLIGGKDSILEWEKSSYNDLVAYISSRRLLVNCRGLVIAELQEFDQDGKMEENGLPFYIRSLDVLSLKPFGLKNRTIPSRMVLYLETEGKAGLKNRTIPSRMVLYLETEGKAAPVEDSTNTTTTTTTNMEKQVVELKAANKTLKSDKETAERKAEKAKQERDAAKSDKETAERKAEKAQQERDAAKQELDAAKSDKETAERNAEKAQQERDAAEQERDAAEQERDAAKSDKEALKSDKETAERNAEKAAQERDAAKRDKETAERKAADLQTQIDSLTAINNDKKKEVWMNEFSDQDGNWKAFDGLNKEIYRIGISCPTLMDWSTYFMEDDLTTNVQSSQIIYVGYPQDANNKIVCSPDAAEASPGIFGYKAVRLNDLNPNKERARFNFLEWYRGTNDGDMYAIKEFRFNGCPQPPLDSAKLSPEEVKSLNLLGS